MRRLIGSGYPSEDEYGYSRAVRVDNQIWLSGTTARGDALALNAYGQARNALELIEAALREAGAGMENVVKTVAYLVDFADLDHVTRAHREAFGTIRPVSTVVEVSRLSPDAARIEFDVTAALEAVAPDRS